MTSNKEMFVQSVREDEMKKRLCFFTMILGAVFSWGCGGYLVWGIPGNKGGYHTGNLLFFYDRGDDDVRTD